MAPLLHGYVTFKGIVVDLVSLDLTYTLISEKYTFKGFKTSLFKLEVYNFIS